MLAMLAMALLGLPPLDTLTPTPATTPAPVTATPATPFHFESVRTLDDMAAFVRTHFPPGTDRAALRHAFVAQGQATLKQRPHDPTSEKYLYDINLCHYYIWRWNISADYDSLGRLQQAYVNGLAVPASEGPLRDLRPSRIDQTEKKTTIALFQRPRPEADKGESSLGYMLLDADNDLSTTQDQLVFGAGPSRADPFDMGPMRAYGPLDQWRSIFDSDPADRIVPYAGDCAAADRQYARPPP